MSTPLRWILCAAAIANGLPSVAGAATPPPSQVVLEGTAPVPERVVEALRRYQSVRGATFQDWSEDGESIFVSTRFGKVNQIHRVDHPGGARHQLTFFDEPSRSAQRRPEASDLLFAIDEGGSEFYQLLVLDPSSGETHRITDGESRNGSALWSDDGGRVAFQSTRRNGRSNDVWVASPEDPEEARLVVEAPDGAWWVPTDWSPDSQRLLVGQYVSATDSRVHLLDLSTETLQRIAGEDENPASFLGVTPTFTPDGEGVFVATDVDGEFTQLGVLSLASGEIDYITSEIPWNVESLAVSKDGRRAAFTVNEDGMSRLYLMDPKSFSYRPVDLPSGLVGGLRFSPSGHRLAMTLNTPQTPSDVFTLDLGELPTEAGELVRWTFSEVGGLDTSGFAAPELVHYESFDGRTIPAFVYRPPGEGPHPVVIAIHGGPEGQARPAFSSRYQGWIDLLGVAVIRPNVRGSRGYGKTYLGLDNGMNREDSVRDIGALLDWIEEQEDLDSGRVAVQGGSYGGYMVLASLVHFGDRLKAGVDIVGISNFVTFLENTQDYRRDLRRVEYGDERDPAMRAHLESISPNRHVDKIRTPLFVAQGQNDPRVPVTESEQIVREMREAGLDVWYMNALNEGHGFAKRENRDLFAQLTVVFLEQHLLSSADSAEPSP